MPQINKPASNMKWDRINTIYELLNRTSEGVTISQLSKELGVSTKTIQRDLYEVLESFGAVKYGRAWKIDKKLSSDTLNPNERIILGILDEMAKNGGISFYGKAHSLLSKITQQLEHPIFANLDSESLDESHIETFSKLENAIKAKTEVTFEYRKGSFRVKPLKLAFFEGFWYLLCLDVSNNDKFKKFHLKSIANLTLINEPFQVSSNIEERLKKANSIWFDLDKELFDVHLFIDKEVVKYFERKPLKSQSIVGKESDGSIELIVRITDAMEIVPLILYYIPYIKVLEPQWLADRVKKQILTYAESLS
ncbi:MAG: hypothetical protein QG560_117 [Campylobacterota bacterium]|nr:hypothetical protein [Campylobacterota bacterium]MDQ1337928.1 hypothetical protein [Campylobacterota bacterium]